MFHVYILKCSDGTYYTGHTDDLDRRIAEHQSGTIPGYTADRRPIELMWSETFQTRIEALDREAQVKDWSKKKKEGLFRGDWSTISTAASSRRTHLDKLDAARTEREGSANTQPVIVLVRPQLGQNIGKAARAMLNFGLTEMRLVAPRDGWPNPEAGPAASGADSVLRDATVYETVADAVADCAHVYATTVRKRGITKPVVTPEAAASAIRAEAGRSAILFGPERSGLETDDVALARTILTVPINPEFGSLNLAQAVILVAYEWSKGQDLASPPVVDLGEPAPHEELEGMIGQLDDMLEAARFFFPPERAATSRRTLRTLLTKPGWTSQEVRTMRGVLSALDGAKRRR
ncbi:TrmH family RNA methyltransferase [Sphingomonas sp. Leaf10]|uniref:TrmH family RNA methyltransferase n=1 Tax=Sphingomonas sp. Leaf10 TaxID=1735676 RepID=UPI0009E77E34|nr:TrmH family RNA methyltransferase [Sphingomonas sp. Leaf10]